MTITSSAQNIASAGKFVAVMSTNMETDNPEKDLSVPLGLLGAIKEKFVWVSEVSVPTGDGSKDGCYVTSSMDATTHFQSSSEEVLAMYERIIGEPLDLKTKPAEE